MRDLFGGTRNDPGNVYRLIVRQAGARFLARRVGRPHDPAQRRPRRAFQADRPARRRRHGLRSRGQRRDGFDGEIELGMEICRRA